jgi:hypothetical protein
VTEDIGLVRVDNDVDDELKSITGSVSFPPITATAEAALLVKDDPSTRGVDPATAAVLLDERPADGDLLCCC